MDAVTRPRILLASPTRDSHVHTLKGGVWTPHLHRVRLRSRPLRRRTRCFSAFLLQCAVLTAASSLSAILALRACLVCLA